MVRSLCRINLPTSAQTHSTCLRHLLSIKCTKFRQLVLVNPRHNGRSRKGERTTYPYLLPCTRALVRRGDEDGDRRMQQDESKDADEKIPEKPKRMVAKHTRRPMRLGIIWLPWTWHKVKHLPSEWILVIRAVMRRRRKLLRPKRWVQRYFFHCMHHWYMKYLLCMYT